MIWRKVFFFFLLIFGAGRIPKNVLAFFPFNCTILKTFRELYELPLWCHKHFGLVMSHLGPIFGSVVVNLVTIPITEAT